MLIGLNVCSWTLMYAHRTNYMLILYAHRPYCMLLELIKITRLEPTRKGSLSGIEIESKEVSISK